MHRRSLVLLVLVACALAPRAESQQPPCPTLPSGYAFVIGGDRMALSPPYTVRATRGTRHCDITLSACGADNTWTANDVIAAITQPVVAAALTEHAVFGNPRDPSPFVLEHGRDRLTVGGACPNVIGMTCRATPPEVAAMVQVLTGIHRYRLRPPECAGL